MHGHVVCINFSNVKCIVDILNYYTWQMQRPGKNKNNYITSTRRHLVENQNEEFKNLNNFRLIILNDLKSM